jgi:multiple sugar transport system substrate-binding protein
MKMVKTKWLLILFVLGLVLSGSVLAQDEQSFEGRTLTFATVQPHAVASRYLAELFTAETGATVEVIDVPYDTIAEEAILDVASGAAQYDVVEIWYPSLGSLADNGVLVDLTDWWDANAETIDAADFATTITDPYTLWNGRRWAVPYDGDTHILFYNTVLFEQYGIENPPATWDEYLEICQTITEAGQADGVYGCAIMGANIPLILIGTFVNRLGGYGGSFFDAEGNPTINSPEAVAALEALVAQSAFALPTPSAVAFDEALGGFLTGKVGMVEFWTDLGQMSDNPEMSQIGEQWAAVPMPAGSGENARVAPALNAGFSVGISTLTDDRELAEAFLLFIARPDINVQVNTIVGGLDPTRISTYDNEAYREHVTPELADTAKAALTGATAWPTDPLWPELQTILNDNLAAALIGDKTPQQALDDTQAAWEEILGA